MKRELCEQACKALNDAFKKDPNAIYNLQCIRVPCNQELADDPHIIVDQIPVIDGQHYSVGLLGIINGLLSSVHSDYFIASQWADELDGLGRRKLVGFCLIDRE